MDENTDSKSTQRINQSTKNSKKHIKNKTPRVNKFFFVIMVITMSFLAGIFGVWAAVKYEIISIEPTINEQSSTIISQEGEIVAKIASDISPSVVSIITSQTTSDVFGGETESQGAGTGVMVSDDGYILTNKHVIPDSVREVNVILSDGTTYEDVRVIGRDPSNDIAFLKIDSETSFTPARLGNSEQIEVGQKVIAVGNALGQFQNSVTQGIISGIGRPIIAQSEQGADSLTNLLQTDAAINPGNSGGPLLNMNGEVVGINTAIVEDAQGLGFAIPINDAKGLLEGVLATGQVTKPYLGVQYVGLSPSNYRYYEAPVSLGALIYGDNPVVGSSPAAKAGLKEGDVITHVNSQPINERATLASRLNFYRPGDTVTLAVVRGEEQLNVEVTLAEFK